MRTLSLSLALIATPALSSVAAQATCYRALSDVLSYFLGIAKPTDLVVCQVGGCPTSCSAFFGSRCFCGSALPIAAVPNGALQI